ncbi:MAG: acetaldehyde dehydrogenase (acetylating) [Alicyclobacillaceae bacterium]|nr:acetaldehyde dehydrogenase (acetylating) [Alicyclobacillaceae bacterium]
MISRIDADLVALQLLRDAVSAAKAAQQEFASFSQEQVDRVVQAMAEAAEREAEALAREAVEETGFGVVEHKAIKNRFAAREVFESIRHVKTVGVIREDPQNKVIEAASPFGVIAGIIPSTNPTSTAIFKCLIAVKTRNAIVLSPHPAASRCTVRAAEVCAKAAYAAGAPRGLIGWIERPTLAITEALMKHPDVQLILATGGSGLVRAAYSSGKPAYGVGPGNVPAYIERTADIPRAVRHILDSKTFDNGTICASEQAVIVDRAVRESVIREFRMRGAYFLSPEEKEAVGKVLFPTPGKLNSRIVGKPAAYIASLAGIEVPAGTTVLIGEEDRTGVDVPFSLEKLSPVLGFYTVENWEEGCRLCIDLLELGGRGHSLVVHSQNEDVIREFLLQKPVSRVLVNTPAALGAIGATTGLRPSMTLGCGTFGGNITSDNISVEHLMNIKRLAYGTKEIAVSAPPSASTSGKTAEDGLIQAVVEEVRPLAPNFSPEEISQVVREVMGRMKAGARL